MARRKNQLVDKLGSSPTEARPGWRDAILLGSQAAEEIDEAPKPKRKPSRLKPRRKTYYLSPPLIERIELLAEEENVGISELVSFLLTVAVDQVESGQLEIPTTPGRRRIMR